MKTEDVSPRNDGMVRSRGPSLGLFAWFGLPIPFSERMAMIRDAGFDATSLWWEEDDDMRRRLRHLTPDLARNAGLHIDNLHAPYDGCNDLWSELDEDRRSMVRRHLGWVDDCARHGVDTLVMHVTQGTATPPPNEPGLDSIRRIVEKGEDLGVTIAVENTRSPAHLDWLFDRIQSPRLGLCYDSSHDWLYCAEPGHLLRRWGPRLLCTHLSDTDGRRDQHWLPRNGVIDFAILRNAASWDKFTGCYLLEVVPRDRGDHVSKFLAEAYKAAVTVADELRGETS